MILTNFLFVKSLLGFCFWSERSQILFWSSLWSRHSSSGAWWGSIRADVTEEQRRAGQNLARAARSV